MQRLDYGREVSLFKLIKFTKGFVGILHQSPTKYSIFLNCRLTAFDSKCGENEEKQKIESDNIATTPLEVMILSAHNRIYHYQGMRNQVKYFSNVPFPNSRTICPINRHHYHFSLQLNTDLNQERLIFRGN